MATALRTDWDCIEFTKTRGWEIRDPESEKIPDFPRLLRWAAERDLVTGVELAALARRAADHPEAAADLVVRAHALRDLVYRVLAPLGAGSLPDAEVLDELNQAWRSVALQRRLTQDDGTFRWTWRTIGRDDAPLERVLWPVIHSAVELLTAPEARRLRLCAADDCGWLFIDASRNRSRRWCDMSDCGNRAKVRRFRARKRSRA